MTITRHAYAITGLIAVLTTLSIGSARYKAPAPPANSSAVTVTNTSAQPVPTTSMGGTVSVSTLPPVTVTGTPNVAVTNTPTVQLQASANIKVNNTAANPIPVSVVNGGGGGGTPTNREMVKGGCLVSFFNSGTGFGDAYTVPAGKQLEIKEIYVYASLTGGEALTYADIKIDGAVFVQWPLEIQKNGSELNGFSNYIATFHNCPFIAKAGDVISFDAGKSTSTNTQQFTGGFVGFLEDAS